MKDVIENATHGQPPKLLDRLRRCLRNKHYSLRTERVCVYWARWYIRFHGLRHPADMGGFEIHAFLSCLANERADSVSTHHQALCALLFLYKNVLAIQLPWMENIQRPVKPARQPTVLARQEIDLIFAQMEGTFLLPAWPRHTSTVRSANAGGFPHRPCEQRCISYSEKPRSHPCLQFEALHQASDQRRSDAKRKSCCFIPFITAVAVQDTHRKLT